MSSHERSPNCPLCEKPSKPAKTIYVSISAPDHGNFATTTMFMSAVCCDACYKNIVQSHKNGACAIKVAVALLLAITAICYFVFPDVPLGRIVLISLLLYGGLLFVAWVSVRMIMMPFEPERDSPLIKEAKRLSRKAFRNVTPDVAFLTERPMDIEIFEFHPPGEE